MTLEDFIALLSAVNAQGSVIFGSGRIEIVFPNRTENFRSVAELRGWLKQKVEQGKAQG